ncbi:MAG: ATP-binding protein [Gammaproteobacteria bacterium]|nr:ATP-binding protein [Gammaproteobacteria bacterium]
MEAIGQLTGGVAHDFNNLLAVILPNAQLLEAELEGRDDLLAMASAIVTASEHGAELIHRLQAFSRKQSLQPKTIDLGLLCSKMNGLLELSLGETFEIELITGDETRNVLADPHGVENAILNLAINASHAMPSGGTLTIEVEDASVTSQEWAEHWEGQTGEYVALRVTDTGTGMPAEVLSHVFEPFFTTKAAGQGSGLGLSMVYGFAQQSGGFVAIESEQGKGTTVTIYLPKAQADQTITKAPKPDADIGNGRGETILVVEDSPAVRNATILLLKKFGFTVLTAEDGDSALEVASSGERIDLLISDMVLPGGMNGIEICNRFRELRPGLKCLFMTGYSSISDEDLPEGTKILSKPIEMGDFATKLRQVLDV